jgi:hypothetical protein
MRAYEFLTESRSGTITVYHGSNKDFPKFDQNKARIVNDLYGGGVAYFTDYPDIAKSYARTMARKYGGEPILYKVKLTLGQLFDVDDEFSGQQLMDFIDAAPSKEVFLRGAKLLPLGANKHAVISQIKSGDKSLTGEQVFKGLSNGMNATKLARNDLKKMGYDTLRYNAGLGNDQYSVYLAYHANNIQIINKLKA